MRCGIIALAATFGVSLLTHATEIENAANEAPIKITINPEARVSVALVGTLPQSLPCGMPTELIVKIVNQGFVTARLEAKLVGDVPPGATLDFHPEPLTGMPEESQTLHIKLTRSGPADITIAFRARSEMPDLGGRDRIHFLMRCQ
jgi:hypothetical protein